LIAHQLETADQAAELLAASGVSEGVFERSPSAPSQRTRE
jgi:hypothetical protein